LVLKISPKYGVEADSKPEWRALRGQIRAGLGASPEVGSGKLGHAGAVLDGQKKEGVVNNQRRDFDV
jgi:hypothetical protein